jgi:GAF domain-containing protein
MPEQRIELTDEQLATLERVAELRGVSVEEAARQLASEQMAERMRRGVNRAPARTYAPAKRTKN